MTLCIRSVFLCILGFCDLDELAKMEMVSTSWNSLVQSLESSALWQRCVHRALGRQKIERYKVALGLKSGQSYHQEGSDLQARNWKRILRLNVSEKLLPKNQKGMRATVLHHHEGPVISMCGGDARAGDLGALTDRLLQEVHISSQEEGTGGSSCIVSQPS